LIGTWYVKDFAQISLNNHDELIYNGGINRAQGIDYTII
jgi:hypothetical protein